MAFPVLVLWKLGVISMSFRIGDMEIGKTFVVHGVGLGNMAIGIDFVVYASGIGGMKIGTGFIIK